MRGPAAREQGKSTKKKTHAVAKRGTSRVGVPRGEKGRAAEKVSAGAGFVVRGRRGPASTKATAPPARMHGGTAALKSLSRASVFARAAAAGRTTPKSLKNSTVKRPPVNRELINRPTGRAGGAAGPILPMTATGRPFFPPTLPPTSPGCPPTYDLQVFRRRAADAFERRERVLAESATAFRRGDKLAAAELAGEARALFSAAAAYNARAAERIFRHHNPSLETDVVDLHGLYVPEALFYFSAHLQRCLRRGETRITCVVGRGKNTAADGGSRLLPAVWALCEQLDVHAECAGAGVLAVCADRPFDPSLAGPTLHRGW